MRRGNLPDGGNDKVTWKRTRSTNKASRQRNSETWRKRTIATLLGVSFETCLRRSEDVLMRRRCFILLRRHHNFPIGCHGDVPLRRYGDDPSRRRWVFHLRHTCDISGMYSETSLRRCHEVLFPGECNLSLINYFNSSSIL